MAVRSWSPLASFRSFKTTTLQCHVVPKRMRNAVTSYPTPKRSSVLVQAQSSYPRAYASSESPSSRSLSSVRTRAALMDSMDFAADGSGDFSDIAPGTRDVRFVSFNEGVFTVRGTLGLAAPAQLVFDTLANYEECARVFHNIKDSTVESTNGHELVVKQNCSWSFLAFSGTFELVFDVKLEEDEHQLEFKLRRSTFMRDFSGKWVIRTIPDSGTCVVDHMLSVKPLMDVPEPIARFTQGVFVHQVNKIFDDLSAEIVRKTAKIK